MDKKLIQEKILRKLMAIKPHKGGNSHTKEKNLVKGLPKHLRGDKLVIKAIEELHQKEFLLRAKNMLFAKFKKLLAFPVPTLKIPLKLFLFRKNNITFIASFM